MITFDDYYRELLAREEVAFTPLVAQWADVDVQAIADDFAQAIAACGLHGESVPLRPGTKNQSAGNQIEKFFVERIGGHLKRFRILSCPGRGYPDKQLREQASSRRFALEIKMTSQWDPGDSNRRVLTCASSKLRDNFEAPIHHLLLTICCDENDGDYSAARVRLDFIQPNTEVGVRLEAEVSHQILSRGGHPSRTL